MPQQIQIKRKTTEGPPDTLAPGELAYRQTGQILYIGDGTSAVQDLVSADRQVELEGDQAITGAKTIDVANLKLTGGAPDNLLTTDGDGNLAFVTAPTGGGLTTPATGAEMDAGTRNDVFATPRNTRSLIGAAVTTLGTTAKTIVPAINEVKAAVDLLGTGQVFVGTLQANAGTIVWTTASGVSGGLPAASAGNKGWYLIADAAGSTPPSGAPAGAYEVGDWLMSDGTAWTRIALGGVSTVTASAVTVSPVVAGADDVQEALGALQTTKVALAGDTMTGPLLVPTPTFPGHAANKQYVDDQTASGLASVAVVGPELTGDGLVATPLKFTGITTSVAFSGTGLLASPLTLLVVDGGTYS